MRKIDRTGETKLNNYGKQMTIIRYGSARSIDVYFTNTKYTATNRAYKEFSTGILKDMYDNTVFGIGYLGEGVYKSVDGKVHNTWRGMLERCYSSNFQKEHKSYVGCTVCKEWHNFQNFAQWYEENYYEIKDEVMCIDKDILVKSNKIYSPDTCVFVSNDINVLFTKTNAKRGLFPIGVCFHKKLNKYQSNCQDNGNNIYLGIHITPDGAFNAYKLYKENLIKQIADKYKDQIPQRLYDAMYKYIVEITD